MRPKAAHRIPHMTGVALFRLRRKPKGGRHSPTRNLEMSLRSSMDEAGAVARFFSGRCKKAPQRSRGLSSRGEVQLEPRLRPRHGDEVTDARKPM